jgi:hypothetical protein
MPGNRARIALTGCPSQLHLWFLGAANGLRERR